MLHPSEVLVDDGSMDTIEGEKKELTPGIEQGTTPDRRGELAMGEETIAEKLSKKTCNLNEFLEDVQVDKIP